MREAPVLRPAMPADEPFLVALCTGTRDEEVAGWGLPETERATLVALQARAQRQGHRAQHPAADEILVLVDGDPAGHLLVDRSGAEIRVVDVALLPAYRRQGIGTHLLTALLDEGRRAQKPVRLRVLRDSPALRLYARLGFAVTDDDGVRVGMEWRHGDR